MIGEIVKHGVHEGLVVRTTLDPKEQPFLYDHRIDGTVLLPGVMGIEGFAEAARLLAPDRHVAGSREPRVRGTVEVLPGRAAARSPSPPCSGRTPPTVRTWSPSAPDRRASAAWQRCTAGDDALHRHGPAHHRRTAGAE